MVSLIIYLGHRLDPHEAMAGAGAMTTDDLVERTGGDGV